MVLIYGIYNWQEINNGGLFPDNQWWQVQYESCSWYNLAFAMGLFG